MTRSDLTFELFDYDELTRDQLYALLRLRHRVFVLGQEITEAAEIDGRDPDSEHAVVLEGGELVATARLRPKGERAKVERVAVAPARQREGIGTFLMRELQAALGDRAAVLHAQRYLRDWYDRLGWEQVGEPFVEADIEHVEMIWSSDD
ncbi:MAG: GNAT family N-acetyltransferase [Bradymonadaceae bacterium]